jgi:hypothetical protein
LVRLEQIDHPFGADLPMAGNPVERRGRGVLRGPVCKERSRVFRGEVTEDGVEHPLPRSEQGGSLVKEVRRLWRLLFPEHHRPAGCCLRCVERVGPRIET